MTTLLSAPQAPSSLWTSAPARKRPSVSIIVPTYHEVENLLELILRLDAVRRIHGLDVELLIMDDDSRDGSQELIDSLALPWVRMVVRTGERGLSLAVIDGFALAGNEIIVVMDADLSHPPEKIPEMLARIIVGADFVIGSRYVDGGQTHEHWGFLRVMNSGIATWLARPFTPAADPMSGFFAFRRELLGSATKLCPIGYKIGLEALVKLPIRRMEEIPIFFSERTHGHSKLTLREQGRYLRHLRRLAIYKYPAASQLAQFLAIGALGTIINLGMLTLLLLFGEPPKVSIGLAIAVSMLSNFWLNRWLTLSEARNGVLARQLLSFIAAYSLGAVVNYGISIWLLDGWSGMAPQWAALGGAAVGAGLNYLAHRRLASH